jgi:hypothetical protein
MKHFELTKLQKKARLLASMSEIDFLPILIPFFRMAQDSFLNLVIIQSRSVPPKKSQ